MKMKVILNFQRNKEILFEKRKNEQNKEKCKGKKQGKMKTKTIN